MIYNLTDGIIYIDGEGGDIKEVPWAGTRAHTFERPERRMGAIGGIAMLKAEVHIFGLPEPIPGVTYVTSKEVAHYAVMKGRRDVAFPTGARKKEGFYVYTALCLP